MRNNEEYERLKEKAISTLLLMQTVDGYILYEFDGRHPILTNERFDADKGYVSISKELRENYPSFNVIYHENRVNRADTGDTAIKIYKQMLVVKEQITVQPKIADAKASTPENQDKQTEAIILNPPSITPVNNSIPNIMKTANQSSTVNNEAQAAPQVPVMRKVEGVTRFGAVKVVKGFCGPTHFVLQSAADLVAAGEGKALKYLLESSDDYTVFMKNRQEKTRKAQQYAIEKAAIIPNSIMSACKRTPASQPEIIIPTAQ